MANPFQRPVRSVQRALAGRLGSLLIVAVGTALVVGSGAGVYLVLENVPRVRPIEVHDVVLVAREVGEKQAITTDALRLAQVPSELIPSNAVTNLDEVRGKTAAVKLMPGEMLLRNRIGERTSETLLSAQLAPNELAVTFPATGIASVGWLLPGDRVDVLVTLLPGANQTGPEAVTTVALQNLRVLSVTRGAGAPRPPAASGVMGLVAGTGEISGQVVLAATYADALFLKALKDASKSTLDLVLRPTEARELTPADT